MHIRRFVLTTEENTAMQRVSHRLIKCQSRSGSHQEARRSTGHIMVPTRYSDQQGSKSRQSPGHVQPPENIGTLSALRQRLRVQSAAPVVQNLNYKLQRGLHDVLPAHIPKSSKYFKKLSPLCEGYTKTSCATLFYKQWHHRPMPKRFTKHLSSILSTTSMDFNFCRLPTASAYQQQGG